MCARDITRTVENDINAERVRQEAKWGEQNHNPFIYLSILTEEVGEAHQAALHSYFPQEQWDAAALAHYREELVQVAAVAKAALECFDRGKWAK